jgi:hypothetical protein
MRLGAVWLTAVVAGLGAAPAFACSLAVGLAPPKPPLGLSPEQDAKFLRDWEEAEARRKEVQAEQWRLQYQTEKWNEADGALVARIETVAPYELQTQWGYSLDLVRIEMRPVRWIKGGGELLPFQLTATGIDSCGSYYPYWKGLGGKPGEEFVVYFRGSAPSQETTLEAISPASIIEPRTIEALTKGPE